MMIKILVFCNLTWLASMVKIWIINNFP
jgi:hypothetical protein